MFGDAGFFGVFFDNTLDRARSEAAVVAVLGRDTGIFGVIEEEGGEGIVADGEIIFDAGSGGLVDENRAVFAAFAADDELAAV